MPENKESTAISVLSSNSNDDGISAASSDNLSFLSGTGPSPNNNVTSDAATTASDSLISGCDDTGTMASNADNTSVSSYILSQDSATNDDALTLDSNMSSTLLSGTTQDSATNYDESTMITEESEGTSQYTEGDTIDDGPTTDSTTITGTTTTTTTTTTSDEENDHTTVSSITSPSFSRYGQQTQANNSANNANSNAIESNNDKSNTNNAINRPNFLQHHAVSTPPAPQPSMTPIDSITSRLLGLRGSPPGTLCSLAENEIKLLCQRVRPILLQQPMLLELEAPLKICGDVHGQFTDLLRLFEYGGFPPEANYLFLGDYVDRGKQSLETISLLFCYKIKYPENFFILRGNHESAGINRIYGFYDECKRRYSIKLWKIFSDCFNCLPVCALVDEKILCMHGGLSPEMHNLQQIAELPRPADVPDVGLMCDLLWSDPDPTINVSAVQFSAILCVF